MNIGRHGASLLLHIDLAARCAPQAVHSAECLGLAETCRLPKLDMATMVTAEQHVPMRPKTQLEAPTVMVSPKMYADEEPARADSR